MKLFGLDLLAVALLFLQGRSSHGQEPLSLVLYNDGQGSKPQYFPEGSCIPIINPQGFRMYAVYHPVPVECFNFSDAKCTVASKPPSEFLSEGYSPVPPTASGYSKCMT